MSLPPTTPCTNAAAGDEDWQRLQQLADSVYNEITMKKLKESQKIILNPSELSLQYYVTLLQL